MCTALKKMTEQDLIKPEMISHRKRPRPVLYHTWGWTWNDGLKILDGIFHLVNREKKLIIKSSVVVEWKETEISGQSMFKQNLNTHLTCLNLDSIPSEFGFDDLNGSTISKVLRKEGDYSFHLQEQKCLYMNSFIFTSIYLTFVWIQHSKQFYMHPSESKHH